jgi:hypothetical protein
MVASTVSRKQAPGGPGQPRWLLLIHQLPPKPDYLRVKVRRRLQALGAIPLKNSVYVLPRTPETLEDFQWLRREIVDLGGEATLCASGLVEGVSDAQLEEAFRAERNAEYAALAQAAQAAARDPGPGHVDRLRRRLGSAAARDHFAAPGRSAAEQAVRDLEPGRPGGATEQSVAGPTARRPRRATWVTRAGVHVDRIASAWLIRRFIDPDARFAFTTAARYRPRRGELRFDMFEGEFTHDGDRCTFETLCARFGLRQPALAAIGQIVHDIDCKDDKFGRVETDGIATVIRGISLARDGDEARLEAGRAVFDGLYEQLKRTV